MKAHYTTSYYTYRASPVKAVTCSMCIVGCTGPNSKFGSHSIFIFIFVSITQHLKLKVNNNFLRPFTVQKFRFVSLKIILDIITVLPNSHL